MIKIPELEIVEYKDGFDRSVYRVRKRVLKFFWRFEFDHYTERPYEWLEDRRAAEHYVNSATDDYLRKVRKKVNNA